MKDYYLILGLEPNATQEDIKKAYREMSLKYHPDKNKGDKYFEERFKDITEAYNILSDTVSRQSYDYEWLRYFREKQSKNADRQQTNKVNKESLTQNFTTKEIESKKKKPKSTFNIILIILIIALTLYILGSKSSSDEEIQNLSHAVDQLREESNDQLKTIRSLIIEKARLKIKNNELIALNKKSLAQTTKSKNTLLNHEGSVPLTNKTYVNNLADIIITRIEWENDLFEGKRELAAISVLNKKSSAIFDVKLFYEITNSDGQKVDAGEVLLFEGFELNGKRQAYNLNGRQVYPNSAVQWKPHNVYIRKKDSEYMNISIKSYDTAN